LPSVPLASAVTVQLVNSDGVCWETTYSAPRKNGAGTLKAKGD